MHLLFEIVLEHYPNEVANFAKALSKAYEADMAHNDPLMRWYKQGSSQAES